MLVLPVATATVNASLAAPSLTAIPPSNDASPVTLTAAVVVTSPKLSTVKFDPFTSIPPSNDASPVAVSVVKVVSPSTFKVVSKSTAPVTPSTPVVATSPVANASTVVCPSTSSVPLISVLPVAPKTVNVSIGVMAVES